MNSALPCESRQVSSSVVLKFNKPVSKENENVAQKREENLLKVLSHAFDVKSRFMTSRVELLMGKLRVKPG